MHQTQLHKKIKQHEAQCQRRQEAFFKVAEARDVEDGLIAVRDTSGEYTLYFDKERFVAVRDNIDDSDKIPDFPENTGFVVNVMARSWDTIIYYARQVLTPKMKTTLRH